MPKNQVTDLITDQEMLFGRFILSGEMTDRQAAEAAGLNPESAAYTKSKPRVRAYMLEHRAAVQQQLVDQELDQQRRLKETRERVLARLWKIADLDPEMTRGSASAQMKALSLIIAIEGLIPNRNHAARPGGNGEFLTAALLKQQQEQDANSQPIPPQQEAAPKAESGPKPADARPPITQPVSGLSAPFTAPLSPMNVFSKVPRVQETGFPFFSENPYAPRR